MTNVESGKAAAEAREHMKNEAKATARHGDPLARYLGAVAYNETRKKDKK
ncbi:hypothetical protein GCM10018954_045230 [Kutzneria kofuensis]